MEKPRNPVRENLKEIAWAVFTIDLMLLPIGLLARAHLGDWMAGVWLFAGWALLVTVMFAVMVFGNWLAVAAVRGVRRLMGRRGLTGLRSSPRPPRLERDTICFGGVCKLG